ncbi:hypothetical protein FVR03_07810 [Pontibacter qinzhouensis]|uniref:Uncharacterized protein n=1 Tax=Pontibacter qinzhouensis TaxID=2603253 RepID=A0A5C8KCC9_9BACT|nr:hypothetical protein [Pontibacter qinzhouensis]TXK48755.1 hypothetical protein FVR03_07810 [Pontibacter qinzhouensis]
MPTRVITFCYRKVIDATATTPWEKLVFDDSYQEFKMQAQYYNQENKYGSFAELLQHSPGAERLHFLVSAAVTAYVQQLNGIVPDILNSVGRHFLKFNNYRFEIINSDVLDKTKHQVAINFVSDPMHWHDTLGQLLLISAEPDNGTEVLTELVPLQPYFTIYSLQTKAIC